MSSAATRKPELKAPIIAGFVASVSGSAATFGIAIAGLLAMGATREQTSTAIFVLLFGYGLLSTVLSYRYKMPISIVWSTPGAAFLAASAGLGLEFEQAVGGFLLSGVLLTVTGFWPALARLVQRIPAAIASAMLAGILFTFVISTVRASVDYPLLVLPFVLVWFLLNRISPVWATPIGIHVQVHLDLIHFGKYGYRGGRSMHPSLGFGSRHPLYAVHA